MSLRGVAWRFRCCARRRFGGSQGVLALRHTLPTAALFVIVLIGTVITVGALTFVPALALGPVVEHLQLFAGQ
jgi:K+-transporting ATPase ATPase A chain